MLNGIARLGAGMLVVTYAATMAGAANNVWSPAATGFWFNLPPLPLPLPPFIPGQNTWWSNLSPPGTGDSATFNGANSYSVILNGDTSHLGDLAVSAGDATVINDSAVHTLSVNSAASGGSQSVYVTGNDTTLSLGNGPGTPVQLVAGRLVSIQAPLSAATLNVRDGSLLEASAFTIGTNGQRGHLEIGGSNSLALANGVAADAMSNDWGLGGGIASVRLTDHAHGIFHGNVRLADDNVMGTNASVVLLSGALAVFENDLTLASAGGNSSVHATIGAFDPGCEIDVYGELTIGNAVDPAGGASVGISGGSVLNIHHATAVNASGVLDVENNGYAAMNTIDILGGAVGVSSGGVIRLEYGANPSLNVHAQGTLYGNGRVEGKVSNSGLVTPPRDTEAPFKGGTLTIAGDYVQSAAGELDIAIGAVDNFDQLHVSGQATFDGRLKVLLAAYDHFSPAVGNSFDILDWGTRTGTFSSLQLPPLAAGLSWNTVQLYTSGVISVGITGDYNSNGTVDAADYIVWRDTFGSPTDLRADGNGDGIVNLIDYQIWSSNFGNPIVTGIAVGDSTRVPEPATGVLLATGAAALALRRRRFNASLLSPSRLIKLTGMNGRRFWIIINPITTKSVRLFFSQQLFFAAFAVPIASPVFATNYTWNAPVGASFFDSPTAWTPNGIPGSGDTASLGLGTYSVLFKSSPTIQDLNVLAGNPTLGSYILPPFSYGPQTLRVTDSVSLPNANGNTSLTLGAPGLVPVTLSSNHLSVLGGAALTVQSGSQIKLGTQFDLHDYFDDPLYNANKIPTFGSTFNGLVTVDGGSSLTLNATESLFTYDWLFQMVTHKGTYPYPIMQDIGTLGGTGQLLIEHNSTGSMVGDLRIANDGSSANGSVVLASGSTFSVGGNIGLATSGAAGIPTALLDINSPDSALTQAADAAGNPTGITVGSGDFGTGTINVGTIDSGSILTSGSNGLTINKSGSVNVGSATTTGTFNANGNVSINGGSLRVAAGSAFNLSSGNTLTIDGGGTADFKTYIPIRNQFHLAVGSLSYVGDLLIGSGGFLGNNVTLSSGQHVSLTGQTTIDPTRLLLVSGGTLNTGKLVNNGMLTLDAATLSAGDTSLAASGTLQIEIFGVDRTILQYGRLASSGNVSLNGALDVNFRSLPSPTPQYVPGINDTFDILDGAISGQFSSITLPTLPAGLTWDTSQLYINGVLRIAAAGVAGDYNINGTVDPADYIVWRKHLGKMYSLPNRDPNSHGPLGMADYGFWRLHFGQTAGSGSSAIVNGVIPEPTTSSLAALLGLALFVYQRRPRFRVAATLVDTPTLSHWARMMAWSRRTHRSVTCLSVMAAVAILTFLPSVRAQTLYHWTGANSQPQIIPDPYDWSNPFNWVAPVGIPAPGPSTELYFHQAPVGVAINNLVGSFVLNGMDFDPSFSGCTIRGNPLNFQGGTSSFMISQSSASLPVTVENDLILNASSPFNLINAGLSVTLSGTISGTGSFNVNGGTTAILSNTGNSYSGGTIIHGGTLRTDAGGALPSGRDVAVQAGTLDLNGTIQSIGSLTLAQSSSFGSGSLVQLGYAGVLALGGNVTYDPSPGAPEASITDGTLSLGSATRTFNIGHGASSYDTVIGARVNGTGGLTKIGSGSLVLTQQTLYSGLTTLSAGVLILGIPNAVTNAVVVNAGTLSMAPLVDYTGSGVTVGDYNQSFGSLAGTGGSVYLRSATLTVGTDNTSTSYAGNLIGYYDSATGYTGSLVKVGAGTLTLSYSGSQFYGVGNIAVNGGVLAVVDDDKLGRAGIGSNSLTVNPAGTLRYIANASTGRTFNLNGGTLEAASGANLILSGATVDGGFLRGAGTFTLANGAALFGTTTFNNTTLSQAGSATLSNFTNGGTLTSAAGKMLTWNGGTNTSSGAITISGTANVSDFTSNGQMTIKSGGAVANTASNLVLGGGSRTTIDAGGQLQMGSGTTIELNSALLVNNGTIIGTTNVNYGSLAKGTGAYGVINVSQGGVFAPGNSPGVVTAAAVSFSNTPMSSGAPVLQIELTSTAIGIEYDQLHVSGQLSLGGTLQVLLLPGFTPAAGQSFDIMDWGSLTGTFSSILLPTLPASLSWNTSRLYTTGAISLGLPGDFNNSGVVDAADYVVWRKNQGTTNVLPNDPTGGTIGTAQYDAWRANFGQSAGAGVALRVAIPEPDVVPLLIAGLLAFVQRRPKVRRPRVEPATSR